MQGQELSVTLTGIGGKSSLPMVNPVFRPYLTPADTAAVESCSGSLYGYVLDHTGRIADIPLNRKLLAVPMEDILKSPTGSPSSTDATKPPSPPWSSKTVS